MTAGQEHFQSWDTVLKDGLRMLRDDVQQPELIAVSCSQQPLKTLLSSDTTLNG